MVVICAFMSHLRYTVSMKFSAANVFSRSLRALLCAVFLCAGGVAWGATYVYYNNVAYTYTGTSTDSDAIIAEVAAGTNRNDSVPSFSDKTIATDNTVIIAFGSALTLEGNWINNGEIVNYGTVTVNNGTFTNTGNIVNKSSGKLKANKTFTNSGSVNNEGIINYNEGGTNTANGTITNSGFIEYDFPSVLKAES